MAEQFYTILTKLGKAKIANATALGTKVNLTKFQVGDGNGSYYNPTEDQTQLRNKVWESNISSITVDENNPNWIVLETIIPGDVGGFMIREAAALDDEGNIISIGKYPETYKPVIGDGSTKDLIIKMILEVSNTSSVTLKLDPTVILATQKDIQILENKIKNIKIPVTSVNSKTGAIELKAEDIKTEDGKSVETQLADIATEVKQNNEDIKFLNIIKRNISIKTTGWIKDSALELYKYKIQDTDITEDTIVDVNIRISDLEKASNFKSSNQSFNGYGELYSDEAPKESIMCDLKLVRQVL